MSHVALMIPTIDRIGGAEKQVLLLAAGLRRRGWRVTLVALAGSGGQAAEALQKDGIGYLSLEMRKGLADPRGWIRLLSWLRREKPDLIHAHLPHAAWMARWSRLPAHTPVVVDTIHSASTGCWPRRLGYRLSRSLPDHVIAVSDAAAQAHLRAGMVLTDRLSVIHNGVDVETWRPAADRIQLRRELGLGEEFVWLSASRLDPVKDIPSMLRAFSLVNSRATLVIAGDGPLRPELESLAERIGIRLRVRFLGFVPDLKPWMQAADGLLLTSLWEGLPLAGLEAGACQLPTVATRVAGTVEVIEDGVTGQLAEPGNHLDLAAAMQRIMAMPLEQQRAMGSRARQRIVERFSLNASLDRLEAIYRHLLSAKKVPAGAFRSRTA